MAIYYIITTLLANEHSKAGWRLVRRERVALGSEGSRVIETDSAALPFLRQLRGLVVNAADSNDSDLN